MTRQFKVTVNGREYDVAVLEVTPGGANPTQTAYVPAVEPAAGAGPAARAITPAPAPAPVASGGGGGDEVAQMGGVVVQIDVKVGQTVAVGDHLLVLEAMKMKNHLLASRAGQVTRILVTAGEAVEGGQSMLTIQ